MSVSWLSQVALSPGCTFGLPWPRGQHPPDTVFSCLDATGRPVPLQSWVTAQWPDDTIQWTAHAIPASMASPSYHVRPAETTDNALAVPSILSVVSDDAIVVDTGKIRVRFGAPHNSAGVVVDHIVTQSNGTVVGQHGRLILQCQDIHGPHAADSHGGGPWTTLHGHVDSVVVEQTGPVRATVVVRGSHRSENGLQDLLPFCLRFYFYAGSDALRIVHTITYNADPETTFVRGIGLRFDVPLHDAPLPDRHVRLAGVDGGVLAEAIQGITGLWKDPGVAVRQRQVAGQPVADLLASQPEFQRLLQWVPAWNDFTLSQLNPDGFLVQKRTAPGRSWVHVPPGGTRAAGLAYLGTATTGGLAVGMRHFWERYPTSLDVRNAAATGPDGHGQLTLWLYSPEAAPMDLRTYHDGLGQRTYAQQLDALQMTYEDWEPGMGTPYGIARTNEIVVYGLDQTPTAAQLGDCFNGLARLVTDPPQLVASPALLYETGALGGGWKPWPSLQATSPTTCRRLAFLFDFYRDQVQQRRWYGFWDHGDVMHTYDSDRHTWRYDVGGYAWDNSELSPDLWLWYFFLSTGRHDVFRLAEALTRHTGEVDVYHLGPYRGLGTRHGVQHWSDSCKQARVSNALYRRAFYYLSGGDERVGELLDETLAAAATFRVLDPYRKVRLRDDRDGYTAAASSGWVDVSLGTDWSALAASWFIAWERRRPHEWQQARARLEQSMQGIGELRNGFVTGRARLHVDSGAIVAPPQDAANTQGRVVVSHLSAMFGLVEVCAGLLDAFEGFAPFESAWIDYCRFFNASQDEQAARYGVPFGHKILRQGHSRLTAYAAQRTGDTVLAKRAWHEFRTGDGYGEAEGKGEDVEWVRQAVPTRFQMGGPVDEVPWLSTNLTSLYALAAIQNMAWAEVDRY